MLAEATTRAIASSHFPKDSRSEAVEAFDPVLVDRVTSLILPQYPEMVAKEYFYQEFAVRDWAEALGGRILAPVRVFAHYHLVGSPESVRFEFSVLPEDEHWFDRLRRDTALAIGLPKADVEYTRVTFDMHDDKPGGTTARVRIAGDAKSLHALRDLPRGALEIVVLSTPLDGPGAPVPPLPDASVPDSTPALLEARAASYVGSSDQKSASGAVGGASSCEIRTEATSHEECSACAARSARAKVEDAMGSTVEQFRARLLEQACRELARVSAAKLDHACATRMLVGLMQSQAFYPRAVASIRAGIGGSGATAAHASTEGYSAFWRAAGVRNVGEEITVIASDVAARVCKIASGLGAAGRGTLDASLLRRELDADPKLWDSISTRWIEDRIASQVGARRPLPAAVARGSAFSSSSAAHESHGAPQEHGLPVESRQSELISSLISAPLSRIECSRSRDYLSACVAGKKHKGGRKHRHHGNKHKSGRKHHRHHHHKEDEDGSSSASSSSGDDHPTSASLAHLRRKSHLSRKTPSGVLPTDILMTREDERCDRAPTCSAPAAAAAAAAASASSLVPPVLEIEAHRGGGGARPTERHANPGFGGFRGPSGSEFHVKRSGDPISSAPAAAGLPVKNCEDCMGHSDAEDDGSDSGYESGGDKPIAIRCALCEAPLPPGVKEIECASCGGKKKKKQAQEMVSCQLCGASLPPGVKDIECAACGGKKKKRQQQEEEALSKVQFSEARVKGSNQRLVRVFNATDDALQVSLQESGPLTPSTLLPGMGSAYKAASASGDAIRVVSGGGSGTARSQSLVGLVEGSRNTVYAIKDASGGQPTLVTLRDLVGKMPAYKHAAVKVVNLMRLAPAGRLDVRLLRKRGGIEVATLRAVELGGQSGYVSVPADDYLVEVRASGQPAPFLAEEVSLKHRNHHTIVLRDGKPAASLLFDDRHEESKAGLAACFLKCTRVASLLADPNQRGILFVPSDEAVAARGLVGASLEASPLERHFAPGNPVQLLAQKNIANNVCVSTQGRRQFVFNDQMTSVFDHKNAAQSCHGVFPHPQNPNVLVAVVDGMPHEFPETD